MRRGGFTLVETLVALSLLAIVAGMAYSFYLFANRQVLWREKKAAAFDGSIALLEAIAKNMQSSRATLSLDEHEWLFLTSRGDTAQYRFEAGELRFQGRSLTIDGRPPVAVAFSCFGRDSLLDADYSGDVEMDELDLDGNGRIEGRETAAISRIQVSVSQSPDEDRTLCVVESIHGCSVLP